MSRGKNNTDVESQSVSRFARELTSEEIERLDSTPVEIFEAIRINNPMKALDHLVNQDATSLYELDAIRAWVRGDLPAKHRRGNPHGPRSDRNWRLFRKFMALLDYKKTRKNYRKAEDASDAIAKEYGFQIEEFRQFRRQSRKQRPKIDRAPSRIDRKPNMKDMYTEWLLGRNRKQR